MNNLAWGLQITVLGMGLVFALLAMLWGLLTLVLVLDKEPVAPELPASEPASSALQSTPEDTAPVAAQPTPALVNGLPADLVAAIMMATMTHKSNLRRQAAPYMRSYWPGSQLFASRWVAAGRSRQNHTWQSRGQK